MTQGNISKYATAVRPAARETIASRQARKPAELAVAITRDTASALAALEAPEVPERVRGYLQDIVQRASALSQGVSVSAAAKELATTTQTVRTWIERGVLESVPNLTPRQVTVRSLGEVLAAVEVIRATGANQRVLTSVVNALEDRHTRDRLAAKAAEFEEREVFDPFDLESIYA